MPADNPRPFDRQLDAALRAYAEPPAALAPGIAPSIDPSAAAASILAHHRQAELARPRRPLLWLWTIPAAACLIALATAAVWFLHAPPQLAIAQPAPPAVPASAFIASAAPAPPAPTRPHRHHVTAAVTEHRLPKLDTFPAPAPLTSQEQALVAFAHNAPPVVRQAVIRSQPSWAPPAIAPLAPATPKNIQEAP